MLAAELSLTGREAEARDVLKRYLSLSSTRARTIAQWKGQMPSNNAYAARHACGYKLANDGVDTRTIQAYLGHKSIQHTVRYTELAPTRFKSLFRD